MDNKVIVLAASLGGPPLVNDILSGLKTGFELPILVLQQMESDFSEPLTAAWSKTTAVNMIRLVDTEILQSGCAYVLPYCTYPEFSTNAGRVEMKSQAVNASGHVSEQWSLVVENCLKQFGDQMILVLLTGLKQVQGKFNSVLEKVKQAGGTIIVCRESESLNSENNEMDIIGGQQIMSIDMIVNHLQKYVGATEQTPSNIYSR